MPSFNAKRFPLFFAECSGHTINPRPPSTPLLSLFCPAVWLRWGLDAAKRGNTQEGGIQSDGRESLGVDFRRCLGEFEGKWPKTKLQRWERTRGQSAPGPSPAVQHNSTPPITQQHSSWYCLCYPACTLDDNMLDVGISFLSPCSS